ncbi:MAG: DUF2764 family protein [Desulfurivibrionaceae bacterium]|nr:DUF2764 family protein [Desulfurivibrionaceae bacterium]
MNNRSEYFTLIASLPPLPTDFSRAGQPINRLRLEKRLDMLSGRDRKIIERLERFLIWERRPEQHSDQAILAAYEEIVNKTEYPLAREIITTLMDTRIIVAALRRRRRGLPPVEPAGSWGRHIAQNWQRTDFGLGARFPWLDHLRLLLDENRVMEAHRLITSRIWDYLNKLADRHYFDFEAVMLYLVRWDLVNNWIKQDHEKGREKFNQLTREVLGQYAELFD